MNILIYIPNISQDWGGVRQYAIALVRILAKDTSNSYYIYHNANDPEIGNLLHDYDHLILVSDENIKNKWLTSQVNRYKRVANFFIRRWKPKKQYGFATAFDKLCQQYKIDLIHCPYQYIPKTSAVKLITTLHDVQELHFPEYFTAEIRAYRANNYLDFLRRADKVIVSYNHVKNDLIKYFNISSEKIEVILLDMGKLWFEKFTSKDIKTIDSLKFTGDFILYPANTWKHKNHVRLLQAIAYLRDKYGVKVQLVCSGHQNEHFEAEIKIELEKLNLEDQVQFIGVVNEQTLYSLYKTCLGVVISTVYEAGSFPLMESILLKVPVICSNVTSLPETINNKRYIFDPFDVQAIAFKIKELWEDENFRIDSIKNSERVSVNLVNNNALEKLMNTYQQL